MLHNVPLIGYTIRAAQSAVGLTDYVVSTEDKEIKNIALSYGAAVVDRPVDLANDDTTSGAVLRHALDVMEDGGARYDLIVCLHPTSPIRDPAHINDAIELLSVSDADTLASVYQLPRKPHANITDGRYYLDPEDGNYSILNASIYAMKRDWFVKTNRHTGGNAIFYQMDFRHSVDIDTEIDFKIAEAMMNG